MEGPLDVIPLGASELILGIPLGATLKVGVSLPSLVG